MPVPAIVAYDDGDLLGVPCYVMTRAPGLVIRDRLPAAFATGHAGRRALGYALADCLAELHAVDPAAVALAGFVCPDGFVERQVRQVARTVGGEWRRTGTRRRRAGRPAGGAHPGQPGGDADPHGDYRLDNCIIDGDNPGPVTAVLDWQLSALGDPLTDLGLFLFYWESGPSVAPGSSPRSPGCRGSPMAPVSPGGGRPVPGCRSTTWTGTGPSRTSSSR